jgi:hypothetical protein
MQAKLEIIEQSPLGDSINAVREALRNAQSDQPINASQSNDSADAPERPRLFLAAINKLFSILSASDVSLTLASRTGRDFLASDLLVIRSQLQKSDFTPLPLSY